MRACESAIIPYNFKDSNVYHVFGDLCYTEGQQIKLGGSFGWACLGFDCLVSEKVQKFEHFVDVALRYNKIQQISIENMIEQIKNIPNQTYQQFGSALVIYNQYIQEIKNDFQNNYLEDKEKNDIQYLQFSEFCLNQVKQMTQQYHLSSYCIGRTNFDNGSMDISHIGYSNGFLDLVCLNYDLIQQMALRDRQIQLITDLEEMLQQSLVCLINRINDNTTFKTRFKITTLDGYDLWIDQTYHKIKQPNFKGIFSNFFFCFCEIDLDAVQIKGLLEYRSAIYSKNLNYENYIRKELSFYSEDIEYSILSQDFLQKHYQDAYNQIIQQKMLEEQNQIIPNQKVCGYRTIN